MRAANPVYDKNGNPEMEKKSVAYDPDAHSKIVALLDEQAASGDVRELFLEWRYVPAVGAPKSWNEFKGEPGHGRHGPVSRDVSRGCQRYV